MKIFKILACVVLSVAIANAAEAQAAQNAAPAAQAPVAYPQPYPAGQPYYPAGLHQKAIDYIQATYPGVWIKDVDWEYYGVEVELANYVVLFFDHNGNLVGQGWDD